MAVRKPLEPKKPSLRARNKKRLAKLKKSMQQNTEEFLDNSTFHGLRYLINPKMSLVDKSFFGIAFIAMVLASGFFIQNVYDKWSRTPVIYSIDPEATYITAEPFPAVTICNMNQAYKSKAEQFSIYSAEYAMLQMLCNHDVNVTIANSISDWSHLKQFIENVSQPCTSMIQHCRYGAVEFNCSKLFHSIISDEGLCCVFNMVHPYYLFESSTPIDFDSYKKDDFVPVAWSAQTGYEDNRPPKYTPLNTAGTGETLGLSVILDVEADNYYCSSSNSIGFKVRLHSPAEQPHVREIGMLLRAGHETKVRINSYKTESEPSLRSMNKEYRRCLFQDEDNLEIFKQYTQRNCEVECLSRLFLKNCGCIPHYMPKFSGNESVCSIYDSSCLELIRITGTKVDHKGDHFNCENLCWPACFEISHEPDFFPIKLGHRGFHISSQAVENLSSEYVERNIAVVKMFYAEGMYRSDEQSEFIGGTDFLARVGGLIGLFFGFSFISLAEVLFYTLIHPWHELRQETAVEVTGKKNTRLMKKNALKKLKNRFKNRFGVKGQYPSPGILVAPTYLSQDVLRSVSDSLERQQLQQNYISQWYLQNQYLP